jgi:hypothetical protein
VILIIGKEVVLKTIILHQVGKKPIPDLIKSSAMNARVNDK